MNSKDRSVFITELRKEKRMTQKQVAEMLYTSRETVSKWERGVNKIDVDTLVALAEIYNVSIVEMIACEKCDDDNKKEIENKIISFIKLNQLRIKRLYQILFGTIIFIFVSSLVLYFLVNYNSIKVYSTSSEGEYFDLNQGLIFLSDKRSFVRFGNLTNKTKKNIESVNIYFTIKDEKITIYDRNDLDSIIIDINKFKEISRDRKNFVENLYIEISNGEHTETLKITTRMLFSNNYFVSVKHNQPLNDYTLPEEKSPYEEEFSIKTNLHTYNCEYDKEGKVLFISIKGNKSYDINYYLVDNTITIIYKKDSISYSIKDGKCNLGNCKKYQKLIDDIIDHVI